MGLVSLLVLLGAPLNHQVRTLEVSAPLLVTLPLYLQGREGALVMAPLLSTGPPPPSPSPPHCWCCLTLSRVCPPLIHACRGPPLPPRPPPSLHGPPFLLTEALCKTKRKTIPSTITAFPSSSSSSLSCSRSPRLITICLFLLLFTQAFTHTPIRSHSFRHLSPIFQ